MSKSPYYKIYIESSNREITYAITSLKFSDSSEKDNMLTLTVSQDFALQLADDDDFQTGVILSFQFGFIGSSPSELHRARITNITHNYREKIDMSVVCLDLGTVIKKVSSRKIWIGKTSTQIAEEIASKYGLEFEGDPTSKVWEDLPQGNRSDLEFLKYLTEREQGGNYSVYIRGNTLYFLKRATKSNSIITFEYGFGDGTVVSFAPTVKESGQGGVSNKAVTTLINPDNSEVTTSEVDKNNEEDTGTLGSHKRVYDENGNQIGELLSEAIIDPTSDEEEAKNIANKRRKEAVLNSLQADLVVEGNPLLIPNTIVTMTNVARRHLGNWLVVEVTHSISQTAFITTMKLRKNGAVKGTVASDKNTTKGSKQIEDKVKLRVYDENGVFLGYSSENSNVKKNNTKIND